MNAAEKTAKANAAAAANRARALLAGEPSGQGCSGKRVFTKDDAKMTARRRSTPTEPWTWYRCLTCMGYHVGHTQGESRATVTAELRERR